jgi:hypothetical protein
MTSPAVEERPAAARMRTVVLKLAPGSRAASAITRVLTSAEKAAPAFT